MPEPTVAEVMTRKVITVVPDTPFRELVLTMFGSGVSALPVINPCGRPVGVVTEADALTKLEFHGGADLPPLLAARRVRRRWRQSSALTAADLMTTPVIVIGVDTPLSTAVCWLAHDEAGRLCVVDGAGHLVGVLARRDLLRVFLRDDAEILADIEREVRLSRRGLRQVSVHVVDAVATLDGTLTFRSAVEYAAHLAHTVYGVIEVHNNLRYEVDDLAMMGL